MITTAVVYDHRGRSGKNEPGPLEIRVTIERKPYYIATGIKVKKSEWQYGSIVNRADAMELSERLAILIKSVEGEINLAIKEGRGISVADIRRRISEKSAGSDTRFIDWCEEKIQGLNVTKGTISHYKTLVIRLIDFGKIKAWRDLTAENILDFDLYLRKLKKDDGQPMLTESSRYNYHKCLKSLINLAISIGVFSDNPYIRLRGKIKRGDKENIEYLIEEEMKAIRELPLIPFSLLDKVRDLFVFQMFTGMAYADMANFNISDYKEVCGVWVNRSERIKTGVPFVNQLLPPVVEVLKKYNMTLPIMSNQDYNRALKIVGEAAGIKVKLHSHLARHTFATYMLSNGVKLQNVSKMLGHTKITQTQRYAKVLAKDVHDDFNMIAEKLKGR